MLKSEWVKPGTGRTVGELRRWVGFRWVGFHEPGVGPMDYYQDPRPTALDIVRWGSPEPYDVERVQEAIRRVEVEGGVEATSKLYVSWDPRLHANVYMTQAQAAVNRVDAAKLRWAEAQAETETVIRLMDYCLTKRRRDRFEAAREVFHGAKAVEQAAWREWQACR